MRYKAELDSLKTHSLPTWFDDAKLGIFIHWGLYSVPAFAEPGDINELIKTVGHGPHLRRNPYAEWYMNSIKFLDSKAHQYHVEYYGEDFKYQDFQAIFEEQSQSMKAKNWAELFKNAGAEYVTMVTKHHDGYTLWPSKYANPEVKGWHAKRDYVGEVANAVRREGLRMGVYYSGVIDWSVRDIAFQSSYTAIKSYQHDQAYINYAEAQYKELIDKYKPSVLWNDIGFPAGYDLSKLFAYYYNNVEDGVINNRWEQIKIPRHPMLQPFVKLGCWIVDKRTKGIDFDCDDDRIWYDFSTAEYCKQEEIVAKKWEMLRGLGYSFGYNKMEGPEHMLDGEQLIHLLVDVVSKNGNLCINVGPRADGSIPNNQMKPLLALGEWLSTNGEAIYGTRPYDRASTVTDQGIHVSFTRKDDAVYAIVLGTCSKEVTIKDFSPTSIKDVRILGYEESLRWRQEREGLSIELPTGSEHNDTFVIKCVCS